jgi:hypothetical protein
LIFRSWSSSYRDKPAINVDMLAMCIYQFSIQKKPRCWRANAVKTHTWDWKNLRCFVLFTWHGLTD